MVGHDGQEAPNPSYLKGKTVGINVKNEEYMGKTQSKVSYFFTPKEKKTLAHQRLWMMKYHSNAQYTH